MQNDKKMEKIRHSLAHLMALAIIEKFPRVKLGIGPTIENGFYYDFGDIKLTDADLPELEKRMQKLIGQNLQFKKEIVSPITAKKAFAKQPYKLELVKELNKDKQKISIYKSGNFTDLCAGPHIKNTSEIIPDAFKLTKIAGAYWKGSEKNPMLTRVYGVAFETKKELEDYLKIMEQAEKCDHRNLSERLSFFMVDEEIGRGLPLWLPKGYKIRHKLEDYIYKLEEKSDYHHVLTPILAKEGLYKKSGHLAHYKEDMYSPIEIDTEKYYLKPMNCPHHHSIFKNKIRSYKELPLRIAEFGHVHRYERSGVLSGLIRARGFTQNDAHIYTTEETLKKEISDTLKLHKKVFDDFKISDYWYRLSLPYFKNKEKFGDVKNKKMWEQGSRVLKNTLKQSGHKFIEAIGEASFYGPKIDIQVKNILGKEETIATIQVDYYSASKFNLSYVDKNGKEKPAIVVHRAIFGSFERFFAFLIEKTCGNLPLWLSPIQARVLAVSEKQNTYAEEIFKKFKNSGIDVELGKSDETLGKRIREAELDKIPYVLIIGEKEVQNKTVNIRHYKRGQEGEIKLDALINKINNEIDNKL